MTKNSLCKWTLCVILIVAFTTYFNHIRTSTTDAVLDEIPNRLVSIPMPNHMQHRQLSSISNEKETGSYANCSPQDKVSRTISQMDSASLLSSSSESGILTISCRDIHYRAPISEIQNYHGPIVVGVLSGAGGKGPLHRDSIRSTWASGYKGVVYFIVAGPWGEIQAEYDKYRDLIWIDEDEVYEGEDSVLPFKTELFIAVISKYATKSASDVSDVSDTTTSSTTTTGLQYLFKTDDDSYVHLAALEEELLGSGYDYWGCCTVDHFRPLRNPTRKYHITFEMYPEEWYPLYCQGAGFAISHKFVSCMVDQHHLQEFRYNPFEDVAIGLLAERCGVTPTSDFKLIQQYRTREASELKQLKERLTEREEVPFLPKPTMKHKIVQHRIKTHVDMYAHHKCVLENC